LINISFEFIQKEGIENLTLKMLATETGTTSSAIYKHFKSKDDLVQTLIRIGLNKFDKYITAVFEAEDKNLLERFFLSGKYYIRFASDNANLYQLLFGTHFTHLKHEIISTTSNEWVGFELLKATIEEGHNSEVFKEDDSYQQAIVIWSSLHGLSLLLLNKFIDMEQADILYENMYETLLVGMLNEHGRSLYKG